MRLPRPFAALLLVVTTYAVAYGAVAFVRSKSSYAGAGETQRASDSDAGEVAHDSLESLRVRQVETERALRAVYRRVSEKRPP